VIDQIKYGSGGAIVTAANFLHSIVFQGDANNNTLTATAAGNSMFGGDGNDYLYGGDGNDTVSGEAGNDFLNGGGGNNILQGGAGNDSLYADYYNNVANDGNNTLVGGIGSDLLQGGGVSDTYQFSKGDGQDTIIDGGGSDKVLLDNTIAKANVALFQTSAGNLQIGYTNSAGDLITVQGQNTANGVVERFQLGDGSYLSNADVNNVIQAMSSYASSHGASFTSLSDVEHNANLMSIINTAWHT
jgi:Ca2+-binding RTX toxin-like protein